MEKNAINNEVYYANGQKTLISQNLEKRSKR